MSRLQSTLVLCVSILVGMPLVAAAAAPWEDAAQFRPAPRAPGVHEVTVRAGSLGGFGSEFSVSTAGVSTGSTGLLASVQYDYRLSAPWAVGLAVGAVAVDAELSIGRGALRASTGSIAMIHLGTTYRPATPPTLPLQPFVYVGAGPYVGSFTTQSLSRFPAGEHRTATAMGTRALVGMDMGFGRMKVSFAGGYHLIGKFDVGSETDADYSGPEFSIGFGMRFGGS